MNKNTTTSRINMFSKDKSHHIGKHNVPITTQRSLHSHNILHGNNEPTSKQRNLHNHNVLHRNGHEMITIRTGGHQTVECAKAALMRRSGYFRALFTSEMRDANLRVANLDNLDADAVETILQWLNREEDEDNDEDDGDDELSMEKMSDILNVCQYLAVSDNLLTKCQEFISKNLTPENCLGWCKYANFQNLEIVKKSSWELLCEEFVQVSEGSEFHELSLAEMKFVIGVQNINVPNEDAVLLACVNWIIHDTRNRKGFFKDVLHEINIEACSLPYLCHVLKTERELIEDPEVKDLFLTALVSHHVERSTPASARDQVVRTRLVTIGGLIPPGMLMSRTIQVKNDDGTWVSLAKIPLNIPNRHCSICTSGDQILFTGGESNGSASKTCMLFNTAANRWTDMDDLRFARYGHASVMVGGDLYVLGGYGEEHESLDVVEKYNFRTQTWDECPAMLAAVCHPLCVVIGMSIYVVSNQCNKNEAKVQVFNTITKKWKKICTVPKEVNLYGACMVAVGDCLYIIGGMAQICWCYDVETGHWRTNLSQPKRVHCYGSAACHDGKIQLFGGASNPNDVDGTCCDLVEEYDLDTNEWRDSAELKLPKKSICPSTNYVKVQLEKYAN